MSGPVPTARGVSVIWHLETPVVLDGVRAHESPPLNDAPESELKLTLPVGLEAVPLLGSLTVVAVLSALYPAITVLLAAIVLHERTGRIQLIGLLISAAAVALISST